MYPLLPVIILALILGVTGPIFLALKYKTWNSAVDVITAIVKQEDLTPESLHPVAWAVPYVSGKKEWSSLTCYQMYSFYATGEHNFPLLNLNSEYDRYKKVMIQCFSYGSYLWFLFLWAIMLIIFPCVMVVRMCENLVKKFFLRTSKQHIHNRQWASALRKWIGERSVILQGVFISLFFAVKMWNTK
jgi:hypothetical protein